MIKNEFTRFLQTLMTEDDPADLRKIANLVLNHLDALIPLSTAQGRRIKKIVELAQAHWETISEDIQCAQQQTVTHICPFTRLKSLSVGPFRGFAKQEDFDLASQLVLIYGPNGTGKSSFCEALEFGLLGSIAEAESKRFRQQDYLINAHTNSFTPPILVGSDHEGNDISIYANEALYRFCFVEKNRIDNFSHIAAQTPAKQSELISTLFGLDAFTDFVRNFTDSIDGKYIDLEGVKSKELNEKRKVLAGHMQQLATTIPEEIQSIETKEKEISETYREGCKFADMVAEIQGGEENTGLIKKIEDELQEQLPQKSYVTIESFDILKHSIENEISELETKQAELSKASQQVSFKQLYEAVTKVQESSAEQCPACQTPLAQVKVNPFDHADSELRKLEHLGLLQEAVQKLGSSISTSLNKLSGLINICCSRCQENNPLSAVQINGEKATTIDWWKSLLQNASDVSTFLEEIEKQVYQLEDADMVIDKIVKEREGKQAELARLRGFSEKIVKLNTRRETAGGSKKKAEEAIAKFDTENAQLIAEVETEKAVVAQNHNIADAYETFVQKLNAYKNGLPSQLVADLGDKVIELYNAFNRNDAEHEKLAGIRLPLSQNQRLEISFNREPDKYFDALHILSEGHIRCMGLAILTAKNLKENCPILIFDDPVNAIDDDHRESIRRTLFEDLFFADKQIVLACHGEELFKDIQNQLHAKKARLTKTVSFLPKTGEHHISVDLNCSPRNYIIAARTHLDRSEIRDALGKSRKALESLTKKVWRYVNRYGDGILTIKMRSATAPIELRHLTEQLKTKIAKADFPDQNKASVLDPLDSLLGINGDSREWRYLNKGTHEEENRAEFDRQTVCQIISALEAIDCALKR